MGGQDAAARYIVWCWRDGRAQQGTTQHQAPRYFARAAFRRLLQENTLVDSSSDSSQLRIMNELQKIKTDLAMLNDEVKRLHDTSPTLDASEDKSPLVSTATSKSKSIKWFS